MSDITIEIRENGSFLVKGLKRLISADGVELEVKEAFSLCRCGESSRKPFCDGTHKTNGFSGARETEKPLYGSKAYNGQEITIHDNRTICAHAAHCTEELADVFKGDARPWINPDGTAVEEAIALIHRCPSGALSYSINGEHFQDFGHEPEISIDDSGPYRVKGHIKLLIDESMAPPAPEHYTLCRCGNSKNKPYCDGSHHQKEKGWDK